MYIVKRRGPTYKLIQDFELQFEDVTVYHSLKNKPSRSPSFHVDSSGHI
jgi:hypothetical protein